MRKSVEIVILPSEQEYRQEYVNVFVKGSFSFRGIPIGFDEKSFDHIFFEPESDTSKKGRFSERRAKKMHFIRAMLAEDISVEMMYEPDRGTVAIFCAHLDCVMYLRNRFGTGKRQIGSFFDFGRDHTKMLEKQKRKCITLSEDQLRDLVK